MRFSGNKDTDFLILMQLNDRELGTVCQVNKYVRSLCEDDIFWMNRIINNMKKTCLIAKNTIHKENKNHNCDQLRTDIYPVKDFFGFETFQDLYKYLKKFTKGMQLWIISDILFQRKILIYLNDRVKIDKFLLPEYMNYDKLIYHYRKTFVESVSKNEIFNVFPKDIPGIDNLSKRTKISFNTPSKELIVIDF